MAFCPECGKSVTAEASKCASCGHELEAAVGAPKTGASRFKGTMMMATAPAIAKAPAGAEPKAAVAAPAPVAAAPAAAAPAVASAAKAQAKATMIGTGLSAAGKPVANALKAAGPGALGGVATANPAAAPVARAAAPNVGGAAPKSTVLGAGVAPVAAAAAAHAAPAAAAPIAAAAAGAVAQAVAARPAGPAGVAKPDDSKRNLAYAQTQHEGAFTAASKAAIATGPAAVPRTSPNFAAASKAAEELDPHAETDPPEPLVRETNVTSELKEEDLLESRDPRYLPGDPMGPQTQQPVAARAPMLRYDDSIPQISRGTRNEKKWLWIAAGLIVVACLGLVIVLASRMGH